MSGGQLIVLDRLGREIKQYSLEEGLATLGSDTACDICVMLSSVQPHHATVVVHANQTVLHNVGGGQTFVNGVPVRVATLRHDDVVAVGGRELRWRYSRPAPHLLRHRPQPPALHEGRARARSRPRRSEPAPRSAPRAPHRDSMPEAVSTRQVAIVQPQRREPRAGDRAEALRNTSPGSTSFNRRPRSSKSDTELASSRGKSDDDKCKSSPATRTPVNLQNTTKATLWIESRKTSPRKSLKEQTPRVAVKQRRAVSAKKKTPLRMAVLKKAQSAQKMRVTKIEGPLTIDHTKQAAIMLMAGHTSKSIWASPKQGKRATYVAKKPSPVKKTVRKSSRRSKESPRVSTVSTRASSSAGSSSNVSNESVDRSVSVVDITDSTRSNASTHSAPSSLTRSPLPSSLRKSALKDPTAKKSTRKTESIKFDLSNIQNNTPNRTFDVSRITDSTNKSQYDAASSEDELTLHYSDTESPPTSPSSRKSIHHQSRKTPEKTGASLQSEDETVKRTDSFDSPRTRKSLRGSLKDKSAISLRPSTKLSEISWNTAVASSARKARQLGSRSELNKSDVESYSIVDLISLDSNDSRSASMYDSASSVDTGVVPFDNSRTSTGRRTRSRGRSLLASTPSVGKTTQPAIPRSQSSTSRSYESLISAQGNSISTRTSKSSSTPENTPKEIILTRVRKSRMSKRSEMNDVSNEENSSPKSSRMSAVTKDTSAGGRIVFINETSDSFSLNNGMSTPSNKNSPEKAETPVLSILSLLDFSHNSSLSDQSQNSNKISASGTRKTRSLSVPIKRTSFKSKSMGVTSRSRRTFERKSPMEIDRRSESTTQDDGDVTPKSAVKLVQEPVKNRHSTAKKPTSKRSVIDNLDESDIVKQLFNSPVKRKLSQSMIEFSRRQRLDPDENSAKRQTRNTVALSEKTPDNSILACSQNFSPEVFVSPLNTPSVNLNLTGIKRLYQKRTPENDLRNVIGVRKLLQTPRNRRSVENDLTDVTGVKAVFRRSPENRLSDVRIKEVFAASPKNDLRRVTGVKTLFQPQEKNKSPHNELEDFRGVKHLFNKTSPRNDLRNVSGVKRTLQRNSPKNDLSDVRGIRRMFRQEKQNDDLSDISGIEQLFNESNPSSGMMDSNSETSFDLLVGKRAVRSYPKAKSFTTKLIQKPKIRKAKSLHSVNMIMNNVEDWLESELMKRVNKDPDSKSVNCKESASTSYSKDASKIKDATTKDKTYLSKNNFVDLSNKSNKSLNKSKNKTNVSRELQKLTTDTVEGNIPIVGSRIRNSSIYKVTSLEISEKKKSTSEIYGSHTLPIKKRSLVEKTTMRTGSEKNKLPIKKRALVHSTPLKGKTNLSLHVSEIGRVSPISVVDVPDASAEKTQQIVTRVIGLPQENQILSPIRTRKSKVVAALEKKTPSVISKVKEKTQRSPVTVRATRGRNTKHSAQVKKRKSSISIAKKTPVPNPQPSAKANRKNVVQAETGEAKVKSPSSTKHTRKRNRNIEPVQSVTSENKKAQKHDSNNVNNAATMTSNEKNDKNSPLEIKEARVTRSQKAIPKPSSKQKPAVKNQTINIESVKSLKENSKTSLDSKSDKNKIIHGESNNESPVEISKPRTRRRRNIDVPDQESKSKTHEIDSQSKVQKETIPEPKTRRNKKNIAQTISQNENNEIEGRSKRSARKVATVESTSGKIPVKKDSQEILQLEVKRKGKSKTVQIDAPNITGRGRSKRKFMNEKISPKINKTSNQQEVDTKKYTRKTKTKEENAEETVACTNSGDEIVVGTKRDRKTHTEVTKQETAVVKNRRVARKDLNRNEERKEMTIPPENIQGSKKSGVESLKVLKPKKTQKVNSSEAVVTTRRTRKGQVAAREESESARGEKVVASVPLGRKRKTNADVVLTKDVESVPAKRSRRATPSYADPGPAPRTRAAKLTEAETVPATRPRRATPSDANTEPAPRTRAAKLIPQSQPAGRSRRR